MQILLTLLNSPTQKYTLAFSCKNSGHFLYKLSYGQFCAKTHKFPLLWQRVSCGNFFNDTVKLLILKTSFLLLVRYVPNIAKRSIWDQCKKKYILRTDWRPTNDLTFGKFQMAISPRGVVWSTSCLVLRWGFWGRRIEWRHFRFRQIEMAISPRRIIRFTPCLVLQWGFRGQRIEWHWFQFDQIQ